MLDTLMLAAVIAQATSFFTHIQTPLFWIAGIGIAYGLGNWILAKVRAR